MSTYQPTCSIKQEKPTERVGFYIAVLVIFLDLGITTVGIKNDWGTEANPFFLWFTLQGTEWMLIGGFGYLLLVALLYNIASNWFAAVMTGLLVAAHSIGTLSWLRLKVLTELDIFFGGHMWFLLVGASLLGALGAILSYIDLRSCPNPLTTRRDPDHCVFFTPTTTERLYFDWILGASSFWVLFVLGPILTSLIVGIVGITQNPRALSGACGGLNKWQRRRGVVYGLLIQGSIAPFIILGVVDLEFGLIEVPTLGIPRDVIILVSLGIALFAWREVRK